MDVNDGFRFPDVVPYLYYPDAAAALTHLVEVFGFHEHSAVRGDQGEIWTAQVRAGAGLVMIGPGLADFGTRPPEPGTPATHRIHVLVADVDAHHQAAVDAGAEVNGAPADHGPVRIYIATDPGGHEWIFATPVDGSTL